MCEVAKAILDGKEREIMKDLKRRPAELRREMKWRIRMLLESSRSSERGRVDVRKLFLEMNGVWGEEEVRVALGFTCREGLWDVARVGCCWAGS